MRTSKTLYWVVAVAFLLSNTAYAQKRGSSSSSSSSRPSSSGSSRPSSSSSRPSSSGSSRPSGSSSGMFGGSKSSSSSTSKPSAASGTIGGSRPTGSGSSMFGGSKPSSVNGGDQKSSSVVGNSTSSKPASSGVSTKAAAQRREESRQAYITTQKAIAPPKSEAVVNGRSVKVDTSMPTVTQLREKPSNYIQPEVRRNRVVNHITVHHYRHPYDYYYSRPVSYGIGPYSNAFWWMMMEWDAQRRADWLYHNQARISAEAYADALRDAEVQRRLAALESQKVARNPNYVDKEFASDPTDMYDQNYVEAAYNPTVMPVSYSGDGSSVSAASVGNFFLLTFVTIGAVAMICWLVFSVRWGK